MLAVGGGALLVGSTSRFRARNTSVDPRRGAEQTALVIEGPNAWTRNPMYLGMTLLLLAHAVRTGQVRALIPAGGFVLWIDRVQIPSEEIALQARFDEAYTSYRRSVPRWLGRRSTPP